MTTPIRSTLLDVVQTVSTYATSDDEVVATVAYLVNSGKVLLCGTFAGARFDLSTLPATPFSPAPLPSEHQDFSIGVALSHGLLPPLALQALTARRQNREQLA